MSKIELDHIQADYASKQRHNANYDAIEDAFNNSLSRDGTTPNEMNANLDMNSNRIINLPDAGSNSEPITYRQWLLGTVTTSLVTDASLITYTASGTGGTLRTLAAKFGDIISVKDYGADSTGASDASTAINDAIVKAVANGGGIVWFPPGTYKLVNPIKLNNLNHRTYTYGVGSRKNIWLMGAGRDSCILKMASFYASGIDSFPYPWTDYTTIPTDAAFTDYVCENIKISGFKIDGDYSVNVDGGTLYGSHYATYGGVWPNGVTNTGAIHYAADTFQYPITIARCNGLEISDCHIKNSWYNGIEVYVSNNVWVHDNIIENCGDKANYLGYESGIEFDGCQNVWCYANTIVNVGNGVLANADPTSYVASHNIHFYDNVIDTTSHGLGMSLFGWLDDVFIHDNLLKNLYWGGIVIVDANVPVAKKHPHKICIKNNIIDDYNVHDGAGQLGIRGFGTNFQINGNQIYQETTTVNDTIGILIDDTGITNETFWKKQNHIKDNMLIGKFLGSGSSTPVIKVAAAGTHTTGNSIQIIGSTCFNGIEIAANNCVTTDNICTGAYSNKAITYTSGTLPIFNNPTFNPNLCLKTTSAQTGLSSANVIDFSGHGTVVIDSAGNYNAAGDGFAASYPGAAYITGTFNVTAITAGEVLSCAIQKNGASIASVGTKSDGQDSQTISVMSTLAVNDIINLAVSTTSGTFTISSGCILTVQYLF